MYFTYHVMKCAVLSRTHTHTLSPFFRSRFFLNDDNHNKSNEVRRGEKKKKKRKKTKRIKVSCHSIWILSSSFFLLRSVSILFLFFPRFFFLLLSVILDFYPKTSAHVSISSFFSTSFLLEFTFSSSSSSSIESNHKNYEYRKSSNSVHYDGYTNILERKSALTCFKIPNIE